MIDKTLKNWIDNASYEELLGRWRFSPVGDPIFQGELGDYYKETIFRKRDKIGALEASRISKLVGWGKYDNTKRYTKEIK